MATLRDIRRRIKAVKSTMQITKAMKMVAAAKLRKAQTRMTEMRPYADKMNEVISSLSADAGEAGVHPLMQSRAIRKVELLVFTSDRGLCGAFNTNILKAAEGFAAQKQAEGLDVTVCSIGKKARDYYKRKNVPLRAHWAGLSGNITYGVAQEVAADATQCFIDEVCDEHYIIYNEFKNVVSQNIVVSKLLPLAPIEARDGGGEGAEGGGQAQDFIFEPSMLEIFNSLLPKNVEVQVFRALLESQASEEAARMSAMANATKAAQEMIDGLTLKYNKARQAAITNELMDIVGGVEALKK